LTTIKKDDMFTVTVRGHNWSKLCYSQALERMKKLIEVGIVDLSCERENLKQT
jgi:hypothetical protein